MDLEGRLVRVATAGATAPATAAATLLTAAGRAIGRPRVVGGSTAAALLAAAGAAAPTAATLATALLTAAEAAALATATAGLGDLGRGVLQARAHFLDVELVDRALHALAVLVRPLLEAALDDHAGPPRKGLGDVLRRLTPHRAGQ